MSYWDAVAMVFYMLTGVAAFIVYMGVAIAGTQSEGWFRITGWVMIALLVLGFIFGVPLLVLHGS